MWNLARSKEPIYVSGGCLQCQQLVFSVYECYRTRLIPMNIIMLGTMVVIKYLNYSEINSESRIWETPARKTINGRNGTWKDTKVTTHVIHFSAPTKSSSQNKSSHQKNELFSSN
ncbi:hypothetical protein QE152_g36889 [Popillia japonica]|uniref:Uncharacterized protein n=1 Tax=Popillia japonica TaxID=7064 RepID=A0AAW1IC55_POPJA